MLSQGNGHSQTSFLYPWKRKPVSHLSNPEVVAIPANTISLCRAIAIHLPPFWSNSMGIHTGAFPALIFFMAVKTSRTEVIWSMWWGVSGWGKLLIMFSAMTDGLKKRSAKCSLQRSKILSGPLMRVDLSLDRRGTTGDDFGPKSCLKRVYRFLVSFRS